MARQSERRRRVFACQECGYQSARWMGFCPAPSCNSGTPLVEIDLAPARSPRSPWVDDNSTLPQELSQVSEESFPRIQLPSPELNRVLGGGLVAGSVVLLAGEPGVGKSTLLLQVAQSMASSGRKVLYACGEESAQQIKLRSQRLRFDGQGIFLLAETDLGPMLEKLEKFRPQILMVDSIQTLYSEEVPSGPGSVAQVREAGLQLTRWAKMRHAPILLAGHITKDGSVAGPRVLEHMVDVVAYLESQEFSSYRLLRSTKNRFGSTAEVGVFEMTGQGLADVPDPSRALLAQRNEHAVGSALVPAVEGSRPLMLEVQALTSPTHLPAPRRVSNGVDHSRMLMIAAVAGRRAGVDLAGQDIIVSVAGGFQVSEPAADLAMALAMASSLRNAAISPELVAFGEIGLSGELRQVPQAQRRLEEAARLGFSQCALPEAALEGLALPEGMKLRPARTLRQLLHAVLEKPDRELQI